MSHVKERVIPTTALAVTTLAGAVLFATQGASHVEETRCEIAVETRSGAVTLHGLVHAVRPLTGSYSFKVDAIGGGNRSNIRQGGEFAARPGVPARVGSVMLGNRGAVYEAILEVETPSGRMTCRERAGAV